MNVIIPMAGLGERFSKAGFVLPKPLILIGNKPMYRYAVDCLPLSLATKVIFILKQSECSHLIENDIHLQYSHLPNYCIEILPESTRGQAETILLAAHHLDPNTSTLVHNCDTYIEEEFNWNSVIEENIDGAIVLFNSLEPRWSYAKINKENTLITEFKEKKVISNHASSGTYYFKKTSYMLDKIKYAIDNNLKENNEFYLSTTYQLMLNEHKLIKPLWTKAMLCFGTPQDLVDSLNALLKKKNKE